MSAHISDDAVVPSKRAPERRIPPSLDAIVMWALSKAAEDRLASAVEFLRVVDTWAMVTEQDQSTPVLLRCAGCAAGYLPGSDHCPECGISVERVTAEHDSAERWPPSRPIDDTASGQHPGPPPLSVELPGSAEVTAAALVAQDSAWFEIPIPATVPLVGYQQLLEELERELVRPGLHLARFVGAPGVGRRRVASTLLGRLASEGRRGIHVQPDPWAAAEPLGAVQRATTQLLQLPCEPMSLEDLREAVGSHGLTERYISGLADLYNLGKPGGLSIDERRVLRAEAWRELVIAESRRRPTALFFEDFDRLDGASRELVQALSAVDTDASLSVLISHRPEFVALWTPGFREVTVGGLDRLDSEELALELCDGELDDDEISWLAERAEGNPLHLIQLLAFYRNNQVSEPPRAMADLIASRMGMMPPEIRSVLQAAAVAGEVVNKKTLAEICDVGDRVGQALAALVSRVFLVSAVDGHRFIHPYVRQVVYTAIPAGIRAEMHSRVARHLSGIDSSPVLLAHHLWHSEVAREEALPQLVAAGEWALSVMDEEGAAVAFRRALKLLPTPTPEVTEPSTRSAWLRTIFGLTSTLARSGSRDEAKVLLDQAKDKAALAGWHVEAARLEVTSAL